MFAHRLWSYLIALAVTAAAVAVRLLLNPILGDRVPLLFQFGIVALLVWRWGVGPAILGALAGFAACDFLFMAPRGVLLFGADAWIVFGGYAISAGLIIFLGGSLRRSRADLRTRVQELQANMAERNRTEQSLAAARQQLQIVVDAMEVPVARCSRSLQYAWVSRGYAEWIGVPPSEIVGRSIQDVVGAAAFAQLRPHFDQVLAGESVRYEEQVDFRGLGPRWIQAVYTPTRDAHGAVDGWVAVVLDVESRKHIEEDLRDADRRKNEFLAVLAHELRNPLAPIRNAVRYLRDAGPPQKDLQDAREIIDRQVDQMTRLVDDLLELSRITQGMVEVRKARIELSQVVRTGVEASRPLIEARGHHLTVSLPEEPIWLEADPVRLAQVLSNLLQNAAKYTDPGGRIWLTARRDGREIALSVRDTGIGLPPGSTDSIFEMFTQTPSGERRSEGGLGIGLALVRGLVELHGGSVEARSDGIGHGSEFVVRLPAPAARGFPAGVPGQVGAAAASRVRHRILVVDDNKDSADSFRMLLALQGHEIRTAYDGVHALAEAEEFRPDIVLLDIGLPRMDGYEVASAIRQRPWGARVLLVAVTGWGLEGDRRRAQEAGFDHHVTKPADLEALEQILRSAADRAQTPA